MRGTGDKTPQRQSDNAWEADQTRARAHRYLISSSINRFCSLSDVMYLAWISLRGATVPVDGAGPPRKPVLGLRLMLTFRWGAGTHTPALTSAGLAPYPYGLVDLRPLPDLIRRCSSSSDICNAKGLLSCFFHVPACLH